MSNTYTATSLTNNLLGSKEGTDLFYTAFKGSGTNAYMSRGNAATGTLTWKAGVGTSVHGASASGRIVGRSAISSLNTATYWTWTTGGNPQPAVAIMGLAGSTSDEGYAIDEAGDSFAGVSSIDGVLNAWVSNNPAANATSLPILAGATASVPNGMSADGNYIVGRNLVSGVERAVLWNVSDANPANWTVIDLTSKATALGILDGFSVLNRAISFGVNGLGEIVIAGNGTLASDSTQRGFVLTIPEPASVAFLALGGLLFSRRRQ